MGRREPAVVHGRTGGRRRLAPLLAASLLIGAATGGEAAAETPSAADGKRVFEAHCVVCHATQPEFHKEGPSLAGVYGRRAGTAPFFPRYRGLKGSQVIWTERTLDAWLADPRAFLDGRSSSMTFQLTGADDRAAVIAYIRTLR